MQGFNSGIQIRDLDQHPIPTSGCRHGAVGQRVPTLVGTRHAQQQAEVAAVEHCEHRARPHFFLEPEVLPIERDRRRQILDEVPNRWCRPALRFLDGL
jgi:hypothetical protein